MYQSTIEPLAFAACSGLLSGRRNGLDGPGPRHRGIQDRETPEHLRTRPGVARKRMRG